MWPQQNFTICHGNKFCLDFSDRDNHPSPGLGSLAKCNPDAPVTPHFSKDLVLLLGYPPRLGSMCSKAGTTHTCMHTLWFSFLIPWAASFFTCLFGSRDHPAPLCGEGGFKGARMVHFIYFVCFQQKAGNDQRWHVGPDTLGLQECFPPALKPASSSHLSLARTVIQPLLQDGVVRRSGVSFKSAVTFRTSVPHPCCPWPLCRSISLAQRSLRLFSFHPFLGDEFFRSSLLSPCFINTCVFHLALALLHHSLLQDLPGLPWLCHCHLSALFPASSPFSDSQNISDRGADSCAAHVSPDSPRLAFLHHHMHILRQLTPVLPGPHTTA